MRTDEVIAKLAALGCQAGPDAASLGTLRQLEAAFAHASDEALANGTTNADARIAVDAGQIAIRLGIAGKALRTAADLGDAPRAVEINLALARSSLLDAMAPLGRLVASGHGGKEWAAADSAAPKAADAPAAAPPAHILLNICRHHREHERYYVQNRTAVAADLHSEANKLKIVAEAWLRKPAAVIDPSIDYRHTAFAPAGCTDLNELNAIAMVGVLFMEGESEPIEIKVLKAKLTGLAAAWRRAGEWLSGMMEAAWDRERAMFAPAYVAVAHQRYNTIVQNWRGSRERLLAARVLEMAMRSLDALPFEPARIRQNRPALGLRFFETAAMLGTAAQLVGRTASDLADNDPNWTDCIRHLEAAPGAA